MLDIEWIPDNVDSGPWAESPFAHGHLAAQKKRPL